MTLASSSGPDLLGFDCRIESGCPTKRLLRRVTRPSFVCLGRRLRSRHHPATFVLALGLEVEDLLLFEQFERRVPEVQMKDLALARQEVVLDVEAVHGLKMSAQDRSRDQLGNFGDLVAAALDGVQRIGASLQMLLVLLVPLRDARVEIPAVIVEARV